MLVPIPLLFISKIREFLFSINSGLRTNAAQQYAELDPSLTAPNVVDPSNILWVKNTVPNILYYGSGQIFTSFDPSVNYNYTTLGSLSRGSPITIGPGSPDNTYTINITDNWIICNKNQTITLTLPSAAAYPGKEIMIKTISNNVISNSSNIVSLDSATISNAILNNQGDWATLVSNGSEWVIMQGFITP